MPTINVHLPPDLHALARIAAAAAGMSLTKWLTRAARMAITRDARESFPPVRAALEQIEREGRTI